MRFVIAYFATGAMVSAALVALRRLGGLTPFRPSEAVAVVLVWPIAIFNRVVARRIGERDELQEYELLVLSEALEHGTSIPEQRMVLGHLAPPHEFSPDKTPQLHCSVCKRPASDH